MYVSFHPSHAISHNKSCKTKLSSCLELRKTSCEKIIHQLLLFFIYYSFQRLKKKYIYIYILFLTHLKAKAVRALGSWISMCVYIYCLKLCKTLCCWTVVDTICQEASAGRWNEMKCRSLDSVLHLFTPCSVFSRCRCRFWGRKRVCASPQDTGNLTSKGNQGCIRSLRQTNRRTDRRADRQTGRSYCYPYLYLVLHCNDIRLVHQKLSTGPPPLDRAINLSRDSPSAIKIQEGTPRAAVGSSHKELSWRVWEGAF